MKTPYRFRAIGSLPEDSPLVDAVVLVLPLVLLAFGLALARFDLREVAAGLGSIVRDPDILINDYVARAGLGTPFVNAGLCSLAAVLILKRSGVVISGPAMAAVFTIAGFSLFGKNVYNIWPVMGGVWLYSRASRRPFSEYVIVALFGTALAPLASEVSFGLGIPQPYNCLAGVAAGLASGFLIPPLAKHLLQFHQGYNLYNIGLTAGMVGTVAMSIFCAFKVGGSGGGAWSQGNLGVYLPFVLALFGSLVAAGLAIGPRSRAGLRGILRSTGRLVSDFPRSYGLGPSLVNMGLVGLIGAAYILLVGGDWNGPTVGALLTMCGFGAFGKHPRNVLPVMAGVGLASLLTVYSPSAEVPLLAALFGTCLAPVAGRYGILAGMLAGALHLIVVVNVGYLHGGLNLYNNGFSGGLVAGILVPVFEAIAERRSERGR
ncbi:MAG TPA: DUF1576 domain-containing protein [Spirochaetales bacterium]|nr:DUF1576 domain-containing protein [Spirochaetales bacterium]